jgi:argininosuccinate synthase
MSRIVLAYSGSLESSIAIPWLADRHGAEIIAVTVDLGQGKDVLEEIRDRALATGALRAHVIDARDLYLRDYIVRGLRAGMLWHGGASMAPALAIPVVAEKLVEIARIEQASTVAHADALGAAAPIDRILHAIDPRLEVKAPAADWAMTHDEQVEYARRRGIALPADMIGGVASRAAGAAPREPALVDVAFVRGVPVGINGVMMPLGDLIASLDILAAAHGVALASLGMLHVAHAALRRIALGDRAEAFSARVADAYVSVLEDGAWFTPLRHALDAYVDSIEQEAAGKVKLQLFQGECSVDACTRAMKRVAVAVAKA